MKNNRGITLLALVITVVVMLILAGVAISAVVDGEGLFNRTQNVVERYEQATKDETDQMQSWINEIDSYLEGVPVNKGEPIASKVKVGDYVNYDAGTWTEEDFNKITSSTGSPTVNKSTALPTTQGQFGGFILGQSRNTNSTPLNSTYTPDYSGWRVWDISGDIVTLISAGHPETYYHRSGYSSASVNILKNRNCSMYVNEYATSAKILTGQEAATWYNRQFGTNYSITENGENNSSFYGKNFTTLEPISVLKNGTYYWLASLYNSNNLYDVDGSYDVVYGNANWAFGVRVLVTLKSDVLLDTSSGDGSESQPWKIAEN